MVYVVKQTVTWRHLHCVFTYIYSILIEEDLCENRYISVKFPWALWFISAFHMETSSYFPFIFLFLCYY